jgi:hypothetical protein
MSVEEKLYEARALLEVVMDGLCNDVVGINQDYYSTTIRVALNAIEEAQNVVNQDFAARREKMLEEQEADRQMQFPFEYQYSPGEGLDLQVGDRLQVSQSEDDEEGEEGDAGFSAGSFGVKLVEEHDDGSATFEVHGSKDQMGKLFSAFFTEAITRGIDSVEQQTDKWVLRSRITSKAKEFADLMARWEWDDELDYEPTIKRVRCELSELIKEHGAVR